MSEERKKKPSKSNEQIRMDDLTCSRESLSNSSSPESAQGHTQRLTRAPPGLLLPWQTRPALSKWPFVP